MNTINEWIWVLPSPCIYYIIRTIARLLLFWFCIAILQTSQLSCIVRETCAFGMCLPLSRTTHSLSCSTLWCKSSHSTLWRNINSDVRERVHLCVRNTTLNVGVQIPRTCLTFSCYYIYWTREHDRLRRGQCMISTFLVSTPPEVLKSSKKATLECNRAHSSKDWCRLM